MQKGELKFALMETQMLTWLSQSTAEVEIPPVLVPQRRAQLGGSRAPGARGDWARYTRDFSINVSLDVLEISSFFQLSS